VIGGKDALQSGVILEAWELWAVKHQAIGDLRTLRW
jgi:hypothetical protein